MATWQVTGDTPGQYEFDAAGNPVLGHIVTFTTGQSNKGSVFVPNSHYNPGAVRALIGPEAARADEIRNLTSTE